MRITVWNEYLHEQHDDAVAAVYPQGIHHALAAQLRARLQNSSGVLTGGLTGELTVGTATLQEPEHGLPAAVLDATDVLLWWGHLAHDKVADEVVERVFQRVMQGMGLIVLHSAHLAKIFTRLMGTTCNLRWREADDRELVWTVNPAHPIARGISQPIELAEHEMYGEFFDIPQPDELVFVSSFSGGEVFRSGCCFHRGKGRVFYFSPGHETYPVYHHAAVGQVLANAVLWAYQPEASAIVNQQSPNVPKDWWR